MQVQTEEQLSAAIELRLPGGISIFVPIQAIDSLPHILQQVAEMLSLSPNIKIYLHAEPVDARKSSADGFPAHLPREVIEVGIPASFQERVDSGELIIKRYEFTEALKTIPSKLVVLQYKKPILAYASDPERELQVEEEANLGEIGRYHPTTAAQVVLGKFGLHLPLYRLQDMFSASGWTSNRSSLDYILELTDEVTQELSRVPYRGASL